MVAAAIAAGMFGAIIGSFLTVVASRVPDRRSIARPGSACPACGHELRWRENVPVLSWLVQRGRCTSCGVRIPARYPALELATAAAFVAVVVVQGTGPGLLVSMPFAALMIVLAVIDAERRVVPNPILVVAAPYAVVAVAAVDLDGLTEHLIAGAAAAAGFLLIALAYPSGMGMGDVKLAGTMGLFLGPAVIPALLAAFASGSVVGAILIARGGMSERKRAVPFVPFLAAGGLLGLLAGPELIDLYADRFL